jgi:hypothetical protein
MVNRSGLGPGVGLVLTILVLAGGLVGPAPAGELIKDGDFESIVDSAHLRRNDEGQNWWESRRQNREARQLLMLSTRPIAGNRTQKAMIKAHPELNTYLSQDLAEPQTGRFRVRFDICIRLIRPEYDRSAFFFAGDASDRKNGPNSTGSERFVFLGWENGDREGKLNLFAREGARSWDERTILARDLDQMTWYTLTVEVDVAGQSYTVQIGDGEVSGPLAAFATRRAGPPAAITHLSFASWNDGAGTFYVDNVSAQSR